MYKNGDICYHPEIIYTVLGLFLVSIMVNVGSIVFICVRKRNVIYERFRETKPTDEATYQL